MPRRRYPPQYNIPSQAPETRTPYYPGVQADIRQLTQLRGPHEDDPGATPTAYVVSTFDARPINAVDWVTYSGSDLGGAANPDTGLAPTGGPYNTASLFFRVPQGRIAVVRDWHTLVVPASGFLIGETAPVIAPNGASNFALRLAFFVDGVAQQSMTGLVLWSLPFGDVFGDAYIIANTGQLIEMRLTSVAPPETAFIQAIMTMHGNLLLSDGRQQQFQPGTNVSIPVIPGA